MVALYLNNNINLILISKIFYVAQVLRLSPTRIELSVSVLSVIHLCPRPLGAGCYSLDSLFWFTSQHDHYSYVMHIKNLTASLHLIGDSREESQNVMECLYGSVFDKQLSINLQDDESVDIHAADL